MYESRFGLRRRPFRPTPDTDAYYPAATHEAASQAILRGLADDEGVILLTSDPGLGKTLLTRQLLEGLDGNTRTVLLANAHVTRNGDLLQAILFDLGLPYQGMTEQVARLAVTESCLEHYRTGGKTLVVVDEAHLLHAEGLEELRLLSNLEGSGGKAVQVVLVGLPVLEETIKKASLSALRQRLTTRAKLEPLDADESAEYLAHQVTAAGGDPEALFGDDVLDILTHAAGGIPRVLNQAAHAAFRLADEAGNDMVDAEAAVEAITRLGLDPAADAEELATDSMPVHLIAARTMMTNVDPPPRTVVANESGRNTIPFAPVILPMEEGPPTFVYSGEGTEGGRDSWGTPTDRVG